jgi:hypothetical protein
MRVAFTITLYHLRRRVTLRSSLVARRAQPLVCYLKIPIDEHTKKFEI